MIGWLGAQVSAESLRSTSLSTFVGLVLCGFVAIISTTAALAKSVGDTLGGFHGLDHPLWFGLMLASGALALDLLLRGFNRSLRYVSRINRPRDDRALGA